ncbi:MAG TPA: DNA primase [Bacteroidota bacterium]|jgi:DNA primase
MRIPPEKIDEIRAATDIVDLIGASVKLKKRGKNYIGLCPFHSEKTPSFNVSADRQMYHCFGCGVGGTAFTFVMEFEKVSFIEAVRSLADRAGIALPTYSPGGDAASDEHEQLYEVCRTAALFFHSSLTAGSEGRLALEYLRHRGFTDETIKAFQLGFAPNSWDAFLKHASEKKISVPLLESAGLIRKRADGSAYDYFRGRAMFPIFSTTGRIVGFGARKLLEDDPLGKYINSPETPIYNKSRILYGLFQAREAIREQEDAILVEGYADLISLFQAGVKNVVASSGTALTVEQILLLSRYTKNVTIVYDADSAGSKAALRGVDLILERDLDVRVAVLPEGEDPDSFVRKQGADAFRELAGESISFIDFIGRMAEREGKLASPEGHAQTVRSIVETISRMPDELKRNFYVKHVAEKYKLYESSLYRELEKILAGKRQPGVGQTVVRKAVPPRPAPVEAPPAQAGEIPPAERDLINAILDGGRPVADYIFGQILLEEFTHPHAKAIAAYLVRRIENGEVIDPATLMDDIEDSGQRKLLASAVFAKYQLSKRWDVSQVEQADPLKLASDALRGIRERSLKRMLAENQRSIEEASRRGGDLLPYLEVSKDLRNKIKELQEKGNAREMPHHEEME